MGKKYQNPIAKVETVTLPRWEYAKLVDTYARYETVKKLVNGLDEYRVWDVLKVLFDGGKEEE